jgi:tRNA G37 N-methylase Trm5
MNTIVTIGNNNMPVDPRLRFNNFENSKCQCLGKRDKSSAGRIDPHAVDICATINRLPYCYTTSSCAGRCFLYRGPGVKSTKQFERFRVAHDRIVDAARYFHLATLRTDPSGGADPIRSVGQFEHVDRQLRSQEQEENKEEEDEQQKGEPQVDLPQPGHTGSTISDNNAYEDAVDVDNSIWLRYEPFILHVACRSLTAAAALMSAARPAFKNVGLTTWNEDSSRYLVAIWGDEGLDMPISAMDGSPLVVQEMAATNNNKPARLAEWLSQLVNERHERNWKKIARFVRSVQEMPLDLGETAVSPDDDKDNNKNNISTVAPRAFDVIGDVALLHSINADYDLEKQGEVGQSILRKNSSIKVVAVRNSKLNGVERVPGLQGVSIIAGPNRDPLITTHGEYGIKCVVDLRQTFFSPRMGPERLRICQQVARGEHVLVLFAGVAMEALQMAGRTEATSVTTIELNDVAVECSRRAHRMLERNKGVKCVGAAERLKIRQGNVLEILPTLPLNFYDRILAPRPKEGSLDCDLGSGDGGVQFLRALLPVLKHNGGECHWYDFVADHEFPQCSRTRHLIELVCHEHNVGIEVLHVARVGSVAMRQLRVCLDFRICEIGRA